MRINIIVEKMKVIQNSLLEFLEDESDAEDKYKNFINLLSTQKIINDKYEFKALLQLLNSIGNHHQRVPNFISKFERLLGHFKNDIKRYFSNSEIFILFKSNKRILLFLIEENVMIIDEHIFSTLITNDVYFKKSYFEYFQPELKPFLTTENIEKYSSKNKSLKSDELIERMKNDVDEDFYIKRKVGENDDYLCQLIRFNKIKEFITFTEQTNLSLDNKIKKSIFETNLFLNIEKVSLIEYASFFGSNDIIKYMQMKGVKLTPSMWYYAVHSGNAELIRYLEENHVSPPENKYDRILYVSIQCHHNDISNYIIDNLIKEEDLQNNIENKYDNYYRFAVMFNNYCFFPENMEYKNMFFYSCEFDYYTLVNLYLEEGNIDINATNI